MFVDVETYVACDLDPAHKLVDDKMRNKLLDSARGNMSIHVLYGLCLLY